MLLTSYFSSELSKKITSSFSVEEKKPLSSYFSSEEHKILNSKSDFGAELLSTFSTERSKKLTSVFSCYETSKSIRLVSKFSGPDILSLRKFLTSYFKSYNNKYLKLTSTFRSLSYYNLMQSKEENLVVSSSFNTEKSIKLSSSFKSFTDINIKLTSSFNFISDYDSLLLKSSFLGPNSEENVSKPSDFIISKAARSLTSKFNLSDQKYSVSVVRLKEKGARLYFDNFYDIDNVENLSDDDKTSLLSIAAAPGEEIDFSSLTFSSALERTGTSLSFSCSNRNFLDKLRAAKLLRQIIRLERLNGAGEIINTYFYITSFSAPDGMKYHKLKRQKEVGEIVSVSAAEEILLTRELERYNREIDFESYDKLTLSEALRTFISHEVSFSDSSLENIIIDISKFRNQKMFEANFIKSICDSLGLVLRTTVDGRSWRVERSWPIRASEMKDNYVRQTSAILKVSSSILNAEPYNCISVSNIGLSSSIGDIGYYIEDVDGNSRAKLIHLFYSIEFLDYYSFKLESLMSEDEVVITRISSDEEVEIEEPEQLQFEFKKAKLSKPISDIDSFEIEWLSSPDYGDADKSISFESNYNIKIKNWENFLGDTEDRPALARCRYKYLRSTFKVEKLKERVSILDNSYLNTIQLVVYTVEKEND